VGEYLLKSGGFNGVGPAFSDNFTIIPWKRSVSSEMALFDALWITSKQFTVHMFQPLLCALAGVCFGHENGEKTVAHPLSGE
jgi:hypothetical protein